MIQPVIPQAFIIWALIIVSILLVAGITYVYTNRNKQLTALLTFTTAVIICFIKLISIVHMRLESSFIGGYNENNVAYVATQPGWDIVYHSWHIWILPVLAVAFVSVIILIITMLYKVSKTTQADIRPATPPAPTPAPPAEPAKTMTSSQRLNTLMAMNAAKKSSQESHEKLAEALLLNASYEIKISDLNLRIRELEQTLADSREELTEELETLELELQAKTKENQYIIDQLSLRTKELKRAQDMFEKLMALHKQEKPL